MLLKLTKKTEKVFLEYLEANHAETVNEKYDYWNYSTELLDNILCKYWFEVRTQKGEHYNINSLKGLLYGLNRNLQQHGVKLDLLTSDCFINSQRSFEDAKRHLKQIGKAVVKHYDEIKPKGMLKTTQFSQHVKFKNMHSMTYHVICQSKRYV